MKKAKTEGYKTFFNGDKSIKLTESRKQTMAEEFKKYPRFVNFINSLKVNSFKDNPPYILNQLDVIIEEAKH